MPGISQDSSEPVSQVIGGIEILVADPCYDAQVPVSQGPVSQAIWGNHPDPGVGEALSDEQAPSDVPELQVANVGLKAELTMLESKFSELTASNQRLEDKVNTLTTLNQSLNDIPSTPNP